MGIFDNLLEKKSKDSEVKDVGIKKGEMAKKSIKKKPKKKSLDALVIIFNQEFLQKESFVNEILTGMSVRDKPYKYWLTEETPMKTFVDEKAQDPSFYIMTSFIQFRIMVGNIFNQESIEVATFQGTKEINGVILSHWSDR